MDIEEVLRLESLKLWVLEEGYFSATVHVSVDKNQSPYPVTRKIGTILEKKGVSYWTVQVWPNDGLCIPLFKDNYLQNN